MDGYIERESAIANRREYNLGGSYDNTELAVPVDAINSIPAADVRPVVRGRWTGHDIGNGRLSIDDDTCSLCGSRFYQIAETGCVWHYCPNCGADMRGES